MVGITFCWNYANRFKRDHNIQPLNYLIICQTIQHLGMPASNSLLQTVLLRNFPQSHLLMKLAGILSIYHKPHAITDSRTQSYRTQAHFVMGNLAAIMQISWRTHTNRHTHLLFQWGVCVCVCFWHGLWPLTWRTISRAASEVWLPVIKNYHCVSTGLSSHTYTHMHTSKNSYACTPLCIPHFVERNSHNTSMKKGNGIYVMGWQ